MDEEEYEESGGSRARVVILILAVLLAAAAAVAVLVYFLLRKSPDEEEVKRMGYAEGVVVETGVTVVDEDSLQDAADFLFLNEDTPEIALEYRNNPKSNDGKNFACHIANAADNVYDMYIAVYSDSNCTDELFRSDRLTPGTALDSLSLARTLEPGVHELAVAFIQVEDGEETVHAQTLVTLDFTVL